MGFLANGTCGLNDLGCLANLRNRTLCEKKTDGKEGVLVHGRNRSHNIY